MKNEAKYYLMSAFYALVSFMASGAVLQTFLLEMGLSAEVVSIYVSVTQIVQLVVMLLISEGVERAGNIIRLTASAMATQSVLIAVLLFFCFFQGASVSFKTIAVFGAGVVVNVALGVYNIAIYKLPYRVIDMRRYGLISGIAGAASGGLGIVFSALMTALVSRYEYFTVMKWFLVLGLVMAGLCYFVTAACRDNGFSVPKAEQKKINLFTYKPFWVLFVPNLFRGIHGGVFGICIAIGYHLELLDSSSASLLLVITNVASIAASLVYSLLARKQMEQWLILISGIVMLVVMPLMVAGGSSTAFLVMYTIGYVAFHLINNAVPVALTKVIDYQVIGQYSAWRMALFTLGTAFAGMVCIPLIDAIGAVSVMTAAGILQVISCGIYFWYIKKTVS